MNSFGEESVIMREKLRPIINRVKTYQEEKKLINSIHERLKEKETVEIGRELRQDPP